MVINTSVSWRKCSKRFFSIHKKFLCFTIMALRRYPTFYYRFQEIWFNDVRCIEPSLYPSLMCNSGSPFKLLYSSDFSKRNLDVQLINSTCCNKFGLISITRYFIFSFFKINFVCRERSDDRKDGGSSELAPPAG